MQSILIVGLAFLSQWAIWLLYTNNTRYREIIAGAAGAMIAMVAAALYAAQGKIHFRFRWRDLLQVIYLPWYVLQDTGKVLGALAKQLCTRAGTASRLATVEFDGGGDEPTSAGRRALAVTYTTITPNSVVLGIVSGRRLLYHQMVKSKVSEMTRHLGARP